MIVVGGLGRGSLATAGVGGVGGDGGGLVLVLLADGGDGGGGAKLPLSTALTRLSAEAFDGTESLTEKGAMDVSLPSGTNMHKSPLGHSPEGQASPLL